MKKVLDKLLQFVVLFFVAYVALVILGSFYGAAVWLLANAADAVGVPYDVFKGVIAAVAAILALWGCLRKGGDL